MKKLIGILLILAGLSFGVEDGGTLRNEGGQHVLIAPTDATGATIKWLKVTADGYLVTTVVPSVALAPTLAIENLTAELAEASYTFGGNTALSFTILNTHSTNILYVGLATGGDYITIYPHSSFSVPSCAEADIWYLASGATTTFDIVFTY